MTTRTSTRAPLLEVGGDRPLLLEPGRAWTVAGGRIDVFAIRVDDGEPVGARTHLFRLGPGEALFGAARHAESGLALLAVGASGTHIAPVSPAVLRAGGEKVAALLNGWIYRVWEAVEETAAQKRSRTLEVGEDAVAEAGACLVPAERVAWVEQLRGASKAVGRAAGLLREGEMLPVSDRGWLLADGPGALRLHATADLLAGEGPGRAAMHVGLARLHEALLGITAERMAEESAAGRERLATRLRAGRSTLRGAITRLAGTLDPPKAGVAVRLRDPEEGHAEDALAAAVRLVLASMGIEAAGAASRVDAEQRSRDPLGALSRAYRVRSRRVVLREGWWREENGPLLGRWAEGARGQVALIPAKGGGYTVIDPTTRASEPVTADVAGKLGPLGFSFYRPFAAQALGIVDVLRFGMQGTKLDLLTLGAMASVMALLGLVTPLATGALFNSIIPGAERSQLVQLTLVLGVCAVATAAFQVVRGVALLRVESRMSAALQAAVWDRLLSLPLPFFRDYTAGDLAVRAMGVEEIRRILSGAVVSGFLAGLFSLVNFFLLFRYDAALGAAAAGLVMLALAVSLAVSWLQLRRQRQILRVRSRTSGVVLQLLTGVAKLKMVGGEVQAFGIWSKLFSEQREHQFRARVAGNWLAVFNAVFPLLCSVVLFRMVAAQAAAGDPMPTGDFLAFAAAFSLCLAGALSTSAAVIGALNAIPLYEQVKPILHALPEVHAGKGDPGELSGAIELHRVNFRYAADGPLILRDVSVRIRPGEFVAFVGPSGSGKSTIFRLLLGFEGPESGSVSYDEQDLAGLDIQAVRRQIGVVMQSGKLMAGDVFTNIVGSSPATLEEAWEAARMAGLDEDLKQMPMGMHTVVNEGGSTLSGGQRQRLMIARAVVNRPRILLFDEATSALDNRTQAIVSQSLDRLKATRVVVAHRLSTILNADRIFVVKAGQVVESGTYAELVAQGGLFAEMAARQTA